MGSEMCIRDRHSIDGGKKIPLGRLRQTLQTAEAAQKLRRAGLDDDGCVGDPGLRSEKTALGNVNQKVVSPEEI